MSASNYLVDAVSEGHDDDVWALKYSTVGLLSGSADGTIKLWDPSQPAEPRSSMTPSTSAGRKPTAIVGLDTEKTHKDPSFALVCTLDSRISRFSLREDSFGKEEATWIAGKGKNPGACWSVSIHPDSEKETFATAGVGNEVLILSSAVNSFGQEKRKIPGRGEFSSCLYSPDGRTLAVVSNTGQLALHDSETGDLVQLITAHIGNIRALAFSPDSSLIITGGDDKQINVYDVRGLTALGREAQSQDYRQANGASSMRSRYSSVGQQVANLSGHTGWVLSISCRSDGRVFASASTDGTIRLWDLAKPSSPCLSVLREHESDVWAVDWADMPSSSGVDSLLGGSVGGGKFASAGKDGQIRWWRSAG